MNVEDSYEGAAERLRRLQFAGINFAPAEAEDESEYDRGENDDAERMRDLEQLATLACDENEQLKTQLEAACGENERMQRLVNTLQEMLAGAQENDTSDENARLAQELGRARGEIDRRERMIATLQEMLAGAQEEAEPVTQENPRLAQELDGALGEVERLQQLVTTLQGMLASAQQTDDEPLMVPKSNGRGLLYGVGIAALGGIAALFLMLRPSAPLPIPAATVAAAPVVTAPVVTAPVVTAPVVAAPPSAPIVPKVSAVIPQVEAPTIPKAAPVHAKLQRRHVVKHAPAKVAHHEAKKHAATARANKFDSHGDDPLAGLNL